MLAPDPLTVRVFQARVPPVGFEDTVNGVRTTYTIDTDAHGQLVLVAVRKRV